LISQNKNGVSALELKRHIGVSYPTAWRVKQKLTQVMMETENEKKLTGLIEVDDAYLVERSSAEKEAVARKISYHL
jgi:hypothetical protein